MKKCIVALGILLFTAANALAAWQDTFVQDFTKNKTETVKNALALEASPQEMIDLLAAAGVETKTVVTALCEAGLSPQELQPFVKLSANELQFLCGGQGNISPILGFPGANPDAFSVSKATNYDGDGKPLGSDGGDGTVDEGTGGGSSDSGGSTVDGGTGGGGTQPPGPASISRP